MINERNRLAKPTPWVRLTRQCIRPMLHTRPHKPEPVDRSSRWWGVPRSSSRSRCGTWSYTRVSMASESSRSLLRTQLGPANSLHSEHGRLRGTNRRKPLEQSGSRLDRPKLRSSRLQVPSRFESDEELGGQSLHEPSCIRPPGQEYKGVRFHGIRGSHCANRDQSLAHHWHRGPKFSESFEVFSRIRG